MFSVGDTIGEYEVASRLSEGGMATLLLGRRSGDPHAAPVAIKVIHEHLSEDWQFVRMFVDEALISVRIRHPNVVQVDELGEQDRVYYLVMEYVHGCSLAQLLRAMSKQGRRMRPEIAVWIARQIAAGLHAAHEMTGHDGALLGVIHRDVSPQNVLLSVDGSVKLLDFGIAKARGRAERTEAGVIKGKIRYMAPEQAAGSEIDRRIDVYALGVVLWEMLTMRRYIEGKGEIEVLRKVQAPTPVPPGAMVEGIDPRTDAAVMRALSPAIAGRPPTAEELAAELAVAVPDGAVGPAHLAELLRLFMADEIEAATRALPAEVSAPIADGMAAAPRVGVDDSTRIATLTSRLEPKPADPSHGEAAGAERRSQNERSEDVRPTVQGAPAFEIVPWRVSDEDDDEATVMDSEGEIASFLDAQRIDAHRSAAHRIDAHRIDPHREAARAPRAEEAAVEPARGRGALGWIGRLLMITVVAFAIGAALTTLWVRFLR